MTSQIDQDLHAAIARLAEVEWKCRARLHILNKEDGSHLLCQECGSSDKAGRIAPFKALRVECPCVPASRSQSCSTECWHECSDWQESYRLGSVPFLRTEHPESCKCRRRGWVPEPDLKRACWRLICWFLRANGDYTISNLSVSPEEDVIRAAENWVKEQKP